MEDARTIRTHCAIVGGGPAGMMLGLLLARGGVEVAVLEKHDDFLRDFRGDTVHPSTLAILHELGLMSRFDSLPQHRVEQLYIQFADARIAFADFRNLPSFPYLALVPQWDFLELLAEEASKRANFRLLRATEGKALSWSGPRVNGVEAEDRRGPLSVRADLVVAADGRNSALRKAAGLEPRHFGAPMDVLWFRLPRAESDPDLTYGIAGRGHVVVMLDRDSYWQIALVVPKGMGAQLRHSSLPDFRAAVARAAPILADRVGELRDWDQLKTLEVRVDRLTHWCRPGLLCIGDAAHAMSPIGGVGINLAIQDAVATANLIGPGLRARNEMSEAILSRVERRRSLPTQLTQVLQLLLQRAVLAKALESAGAPPSLPEALRVVLGSAWVRSLPARAFGTGISSRARRIRQNGGAHPGRARTTAARCSPVALHSDAIRGVAG
jgi:2-polyprenyl-6-methoxyphenol hydroxylase-like FAD-dependent oxidoreductase